MGAWGKCPLTLNYTPPYKRESICTIEGNRYFTSSNSSLENDPNSIPSKRIRQLCRIKHSRLSRDQSPSAIGDNLESSD